MHKLYPHISRAQLQRFVANGYVRINGQKATKNRQLLKDGDIVSLDEFALKEPAVTDIDIPILYEDDDCIVIDKRAGLLTHSKGSFNAEVTVANWLLPKTNGFEANNRSGIVHRLDRGTSGVMVCAKNPQALSWLQKQFSGKKVKKIYIAIVEGEIDPKEAIIDMPIERNPKQPQRFRVGQNGKNAQTYYKFIKLITTAKEPYSLLELRPTTGRTHQLRVHLAYNNHPILGDDFYKGKKARRLYLHANSLEITLTNKDRRIFESPLPKEFEKPE